MVLRLGIGGMRGKSDLSLRHKVEHDFGGMAPGITGVNDYLTFACWNQSLTDRSSDIIDMTLRSVLLPFGHRVDDGSHSGSRRSSTEISRALNTTN
jgi:hypothetical protein